MIAGIAWAAAIEPFNEAQQQWYGPAQVILTAPGANAKPLETALKSSAFEEAERCCNATRRHCLESNSRCGKQLIKTQRTSSSPPTSFSKTARTNQKPSSPLVSSANANSSACCLARSSASSQRWGEARGLIDSRLQWSCAVVGASGRTPLRFVIHVGVGYSQGRSRARDRIRA